MPRLTEAQYQKFMARRDTGAAKQLDLIPSVTPRPLGDLAEEELLRFVRWTAKQHGWLVYHTHDSRGSEPGFPDIVATNGEQLLFSELKSNKGKLTMEQQQWLELLRRIPNLDVHLWRPSHMADVIPAYFSGS